MGRSVLSSSSVYSVVLESHGGSETCKLLGIFTSSDSKTKRAYFLHCSDLRRRKAELIRAMAMTARTLLRRGQSQGWPRNHALAGLLQQERWVGQATKVLSKDPALVVGRPKDRNDIKSGTGATVVYEGAFSDTLRRVKMLSITTCCLSVAGGPLITFFTSPDLSVIMKGALASTMVFLSASTTGALHWFAGPYVHKLTWNPGDKEVEVEVLSWMATRIKKKFRLSDIRTPYTQRPLVTFSANHEYYFIDKDNFPNQELLNKLLPDGRDRVA